MNKLIFVIMMILMVAISGCGPKVCNWYKWPENNFTTTVPAADLGITKSRCDIYRIPNSVAVIKSLLSQGKKVTLLISVRVNEGSSEVSGANIADSFLTLFGSNNNFKLVDRGMSEENSAQASKMTGVTHIYSISTSDSWRLVLLSPIHTSYFTGRLIDNETGNVLVVDRMED
jgi:hypothetical protein